MDGIYNPEWYELPDVSTKTKILILDAPEDVTCLNEELCNLIDLDEQEYGPKDSINAGLSKFTGWKFYNKTTEHLISWVAHVVKNYYFPQGLYLLPVVTQIWGMKYQKGDASPAHNHSPSIVSWTYYPRIEDPSKVQPLELCKVPEGDIELDLSNSAEHIKDMSKNWGEPLLSIPPYTGQLIIFPAYVYHQVRPVENNIERYCIAGNIAHDFDNSTLVNV